MITDYPDVELIENIRYNVKNCGIDTATQERIAVEGYLWGSDPTVLRSHLDSNNEFNVIILSDTVHSSIQFHILIEGIQSFRTPIPREVPRHQP